MVVSFPVPTLCGLIPNLTTHSFLLLARQKDGLQVMKGWECDRGNSALYFTMTIILFSLTDCFSLVPFIMDDALLFFLQKVERLHANLHLLNDDELPQNTHTIFVDSAEEGRVTIII